MRKKNHRSSGSKNREWLNGWMDAREVRLWGGADLRHLTTPKDHRGTEFPFAVSFAIPLIPGIKDTIQSGPNQAYADEYHRVNHRIQEISTSLAELLNERGFQSRPVAASERTESVNLKGEFPHKTAATRAGLGWIGLHCQLITRPFGSWVRLGTVFTDMELPCGPSLEKNFCGRCRKCVEACPAKALTGIKWYPGMKRKDILDVKACDQWKKEHYYPYHKGHICGICSAVCPFGINKLKGRHMKNPGK